VHLGIPLRAAADARFAVRAQHVRTRTIRTFGAAMLAADLAREFHGPFCETGATGW
jgi:hypothetical protein